MTKVGLLVIATNNYIQFAKPLYNSMLKFFLNQDSFERNMFLFTNQETFPGPIRIQQEHEPWPGMTLKRYEIFWNNREALKDMDYLYYCDVDMLFLDHMGTEIIGDLVGTNHPGFWNAPRQVFSYDTNPASKAYIAPNEGTVYYAGGFNGGKRDSYLEMARTISENVKDDLSRNYIAVWHDESHMNRYFIDHPPTITLTPSHCFPEASWAQNLPFKKILFALNKNHKEFQV
jgi:histo-blood group ABO system transferase